MEATVTIALKDYEKMNRDICSYLGNLNNMRRLLVENPNNFGEGIEEVDNHIIAGIVRSKLLDKASAQSKKIETAVATGHYRIIIEFNENPMDPRFPTTKSNQIEL